jgi:hypothetical protein
VDLRHYCEFGNKLSGFNIRQEVYSLTGLASWTLLLLKCGALPTAAYAETVQDVRSSFEQGVSYAKISG